MMMLSVSQSVCLFVVAMFFLPSRERKKNGHMTLCHMLLSHTCIISP